MKTNIKIYKIIILPVIVYGCDSRSRILRVERGGRVLRTRCWGGYLDV